MSSTNKTAELHLSQFIGTDIPSILTDYNGDMQKIDAGVREVKQATAGAVSDLSSVTARVTNAEQDISGLNSTVQGIATRVVGAEGDIDNIQALIPDNASAENKLITEDDIPEATGNLKLLATINPADYNSLNAVLQAVSQALDTFTEHGADNSTIAFINYGAFRLNLVSSAAQTYVFENFNLLSSDSGATITLEQELYHFSYSLNSCYCGVISREIANSTENVTYNKITTKPSQAFKIYGYSSIGE